MIEVKNVSIHFDEKTIFNNFSLVMPENDIYCIVGKSGCGKSTLLRAIGGLQKYTGEIIVNDRKIVKPSRDVAIMYQRYDNFPWLNALDNTLFPIKMIRKPTEQDKEQAMAILKTFELDKDSKKYPHELSGGMNQRLAMASVIMQNPPVLLMDEPLSALDPETRVNLQEFILRFNQLHNQIVIVTHSFEEAEKLSRGKIIRL